MPDWTRLRAAVVLASVLVGVAGLPTWAVEGDRTTSVIAPPPDIVDGHAPAAPAGVARWPVRAAAFPAEFHRQSAIFLGANDLIRDHPEVFVDVVRHLRGHVAVVAFVSNDRQQRRGQKLLKKAGLGRAGVRWERTSVHTMWIRDYGPVFVALPGRHLAVVDGSEAEAIGGGNPAASVPQHVAQRLGLRAMSAGIHFQGGNLLTNGDGLVVTTVTLREDNPLCSDRQIRERLAASLACRQWVILPALVGEPTGHVDMFVTFLAEDVAVVAQCRPEDDAVNAPILDQCAARLSGLQTSRGPMRVYRVPLPDPRDGTWRSYTNVIFANGVLLVPEYSDVDPLLQASVLALYARLLPRWKVVGIPVDAVAALGGALRCVSANMPVRPAAKAPAPDKPADAPGRPANARRQGQSPDPPGPTAPKPQSHPHPLPKAM